MTEARLSTHKGARLCTLAQIKALPAPKALGPIHRPVAHSELIAALTKSLKESMHVKVVAQQWAVGKGGYGVANAALFGTMTLSRKTGGGREAFAIGVRHSTDMSMSIQMVAGMRVFVCDNMVMSGDAVVLRRKHTSGLELEAELNEAINGPPGEAAQGAGQGRREAQEAEAHGRRG